MRPVTGHGQLATKDASLWAASDPRAARDWAAKQRAHAQDMLSNQMFTKLHQEIQRIAAVTILRSDLDSAGNRLIYLIQYPNAPYPYLAYRSGLDGKDQVFYRPTLAGVPAGIDNFLSTRDGRRVAATTYAQDRASFTKFVKVDAKTAYPETLSNVTALVWLDDDDLLYAKGDELRIHRIGVSPDRDKTLAIQPGFRFETGSISADASRILALARSPSGETYIYLLSVRTNALQALCTPLSDVDEAKFFHNTAVIRSRRHSDTYDLYALDRGGRCAVGKTLLRHRALPMIDFFPVRDSLIVEYLDNGDARLYVAKPGSASPPKALVFRENAVTVNQVVQFGRGALFSLDTWLAEPVWYRIGDLTRPSEVEEVAGRQVSQHWASLLEIKEAMVPTLDGESEIPITIVKRRGFTTSNETKTIVYGYGANGWLSTPQFEGSLMAWVLNGGVFVQARIRGGGERGYDWHMAATGIYKIRSAEDYIACARWLGSHGYGNRYHLGLYAISTGAYIGAVAVTHFPGHFAAAFLKSGLYDQIGTDSSEIGDASDPKQIGWITKRSPYQSLQRVQNMPALFLTHGALDEVYPVQQSRRFIAEALALGVAKPEHTFYMEIPSEGHGKTDTYQERLERSFWIQAFFSKTLTGPARSK